MRSYRHIVSSLLLLSSYTLCAATTTGSSDENYSETTAEYLQNLGARLGFDLTASFKGDPAATLLDLSGSTLAEQYSLITLLGAIPVNAYSTALAYFVPSNISGSYPAVNQMANYTFSQGNYNTASTSGGISVSSLIDQKTYQKDPVSQSILNILGTPQATYCMTNDVSDWVSDCSYLYNTKIATNIVGTLPSTDNFFTYDYNETIVPQLNSNTLLGPLLYNTSDDSSNTTSSSSNSDSSNSGLTAENQAQAAENFIRYAARGVTPPTLALRSDYDSLYQTASYSGDDTTSLFNKKIAEQRLAQYIVSLRSYAAQQSLSQSNLYGMLAKRMPQSSSDSKTTTSEALSEFQMATRRLYDPAKKASGSTGSNAQWIDQINDETTSTTTVQKEMAILLAEINYQMYLSRMQQERILATLSLMLLQNTGEPSISSTEVATSSTLTSSTDDASSSDS